MTKRRLSVSGIISLLIYKARDMQKGFPPSEVLFQGKLIHSRLGYAQTKLFIRYFPHKANGKTEWYSIGGMPDRINEDEGCIEACTYTSIKICYAT